MKDQRCLLLACTLAAAAVGFAQKPSRAVAQPPVLPMQAMAATYFGNDAPWYVSNIPWLEIDDAEIQKVYFYRWKLYRSHVREIGPEGTMVTEFLDPVSWGRRPFTDLNDSSSFHILEGRWLRNPAVVDSLIDHLYTGGGNDRHFSESIAAAAEASTWVSGDPAPALRNLAGMRRIFDLWDDHLDKARGLYWVEPIKDATEYTISSIDASGAGFTDTPSKVDRSNGFTLGFAFRPSINSFQYGNAQAIARLSRLAGDTAAADLYAGRAASIQAATLAQLWNPTLAHFTDRYQRSTATVKAGEFIRGRELVGLVPWMFGLVPRAETAQYAAGWKHALNAGELGGKFGLRTVEPSYAKYAVQYRYDTPTGLRECQWNGPSWPFQTSQVLTGMATLLDDYPPAGVTQSDYLRLLRQYTHEHLAADGHPDLQEDYDADTGKPIVGLARSHHYNHSTYVDLILNGLIGIRPRADDTLEIRPLLAAAGPNPIRYFAVEHLRYHGHDVAIVYDADGKRYRIGAGLSVFVDGQRAQGPGPLAATLVKLAPTVASAATTMPVDLAVNVGTPAGPKATASSSVSPAALAQAIDGRLWFFPENPNGWSPSEPGESWYAVDFGAVKNVSAVEVYLFGDESTFAAPTSYRVETMGPDGWKTIASATRIPIANGENRVEFAPAETHAIRVLFASLPRGKTMRLVELKAFGPTPR